MAYECVNFTHEAIEGKADSVPLDQSEFGVVLASTLEAAHDMADLKDVATAPGEQPLHSVLGRCVQEEGTRIVRKLYSSRVNVHVRDRSIHHNRCVNFQNTAIRKEMARVRKQCGAK